MIRHSELGSMSFERARKLKQLIDKHLVVFGGNSRLKIFGLLNCRSGKRMKVTTRVFFQSEEEAIEQGFRPCGICMRKAYLVWKAP